MKQRVHPDMILSRVDWNSLAQCYHETNPATCHRKQSWRYGVKRSFHFNLKVAHTYPVIKLFYFFKIGLRSHRFERIDVDVNFKQAVCFGLNINSGIIKKNKKSKLRYAADSDQTTKKACTKANTRMLAVAPMAPLLPWPRSLAEELTFCMCRNCAPTSSPTGLFRSHLHEWQGWDSSISFLPFLVGLTVSLARSMKAWRTHWRTSGSLDSCMATMYLAPSKTAFLWNT